MGHSLLDDATLARIETLQAEKQRAVESEQFEIAAVLKRQIACLQQRSAGKCARLDGELQALVEAKARAVVNEEFEQAAVLNNQIKVLEKAVYHQHLTCSNHPADEESEGASNWNSGAPEEGDSTRLLTMSPGAFRVERQVKFGMKTGASLAKMPSKSMRMLPEERDFVEKSRRAMLDFGATDSKINGVPTWAYKHAVKGGPSAVLSERPCELQYTFAGHIEDERWYPGAAFQTHVVVPGVNPHLARSRVLDLIGQKKQNILENHTAKIGSTSSPRLFEKAELVIEDSVVELVEGNHVTLRVSGWEDADSAVSLAADPLCCYRSLWFFSAHASGGSLVARVVMNFEQYRRYEVDALELVARTMELQCENLYQAWVKPMAALISDAPFALDTCNADLCPGRLENINNEMYSSSFFADGPADAVFQAIVDGDCLYKCSDVFFDDAVVRLTDSHSLIRQRNGIVLLLTSRRNVDEQLVEVAAVAHAAGNAALDVKSADQVLSAPFYRFSTRWKINQDGNRTVVERSIFDFEQLAEFNITDLPVVLAVFAEKENRRLVDHFRQLYASRDIFVPIGYNGIAKRANFAMRKMPEIIDMAARNQVLAVREMLEVHGADPNYIHVREDSWIISDSTLVFYEEVTPLIAAAENGACDVIKVLFSHPQLDTNLCCCAYNDLDIYNHYTAYDATTNRNHSHAAALLGTRGALPAESDLVIKPTFDSDRNRPIRASTDDNRYFDGHEEEQDWSMPPWEGISGGCERLAATLRDIADTLNVVRKQPLANRTKFLKTLMAEWHPDRRSVHGELELPTKVFQWLQLMKPWFLGAQSRDENKSGRQPLPDECDSTSVEQVPAEAQVLVHPSGVVFSVW